MEIRDWLAIIVIVFIVLILLDGFRRKWIDRKTRIRVKLDKNIPPADVEEDSDVLIKSELPNGGARIKSRRGQDVPVLMDSVNIDEDDIEDYPADMADDPADDVADEEDTDAADWDDEDWEDEIGQESFSAIEDDELDESPATASLEPEPSDEDSDEAFGEVEESDDRVNDDMRDEADSEEDDDAWLDEDLEDEESADSGDDDDLSATTNRNQRAAAAMERIEPTFGDDDLTFGRDDQGELDLEHHDLFEHDDEEEADADAGQEQAEEVLIINVMARPGMIIEGRRMLPVLMKHGMRLGEMSIFHRHADNSGKGPVMFSMANMLRPGTFSISEMETFTTPGVSFFMQLPNKLGNMQCFDQMLKTAQAVKDELDATLKDENRSVFTRQTIEHSRQRIRDFELEMLARK